LEFLDRRLELRHGCRDVGQLDNVGLGRRRELAQLGQCVGLALVLGKEVAERGDDPAGEGDVPGLDVDTRGLGKGFDDGQEGVGRQHRRLVGQCVDDLGHVAGAASWLAGHRIILTSGQQPCGCTFRVPRG